MLSYSDRVRTGDLVGPRVYSTGPGVFWQHMIDSEDKARDILSRYSEYFDTKTIKMYVAGNRQQRQWIIMAARELGLMPTTEGSLNIRQNLNETIDGYPGLEHSIPIYPVYDDYVQLFVATGRAYTPTLLVSYGGRGPRTTSTAARTRTTMPSCAASCPTRWSTGGHCAVHNGSVTKSTSSPTTPAS